MSPFGLKFLEMSLHTEISKLMYNCCSFAQANTLTKYLNNNKEWIINVQNIYVKWTTSVIPSFEHFMMF